MGFEAVAIITPAAGKEQRVREGLQDLAQKVKDGESSCTKYQVYEQTNGSGTNDFVVIEEYTDKAAFDAHMGTETFKELGKTIQEEQLLGKPLDIKTITPIGGFQSR